MKKQNQGTIINIGSSASVRGFKTEAFMQLLNLQCEHYLNVGKQLRPHNIRVCQVNPSEVTTAFAQKDRKERRA